MQLPSLSNSLCMANKGIFFTTLQGYLGFVFFFGLDDSLFSL